MLKVFWLVTAVVSLTLSTYAFIFGSKIIKKTQEAPPIYITYPEGYKDLPELPEKVKKVKKSKK